MPDKNDHSTLACENLKALHYICERVNDFPQWATIIAFYTAVQAIEALFAHDGHHSDQHSDRNYRLKTEKRYQHIWKHYRPLWNDSLIARYMEDGCSPIFGRYMDGESVLKTHVRHNLVQIVKSCRKLMNDDTFLKDCESL